MKYPKSLNKVKTIGIFAPSSGVGNKLERLEIVKKYFENEVAWCSVNLRQKLLHRRSSEFNHICYYLTGQTVSHFPSCGLL